MLHSEFFLFLLFLAGGDQVQPGCPDSRGEVSFLTGDQGSYPGFHSQDQNTETKPTNRNTMLQHLRFRSTSWEAKTSGPTTSVSGSVKGCGCSFVLLYILSVQFVQYLLWEIVGLFGFVLSSTKSTTALQSTQMCHFKHDGKVPASFPVQIEISVLPRCSSALHRSLHAGLRQDTPQNKFWTPLHSIHRFVFFFLSTLPKVKLCNYINICPLSLFCVWLGWALLCANKWDNVRGNTGIHSTHWKLQVDVCCGPNKKNKTKKETFTYIESWFSKRDLQWTCKIQSLCQTHNFRRGNSQVSVSFVHWVLFSHQVMDCKARTS